MSPRRNDRAEGRAGFTMVEVVVALVILAIGVLGLAGTTALVVRQVTLADVTTERSVALQTVVESLKAMNWDDLGTGSAQVGQFSASWTATMDAGRSKIMTIVTVGPGLVSQPAGMPYLGSSVADTFVYRIVEP